MNCQQRRFMKRQKAPHQSYADVLARQREAHEAVEKAARDATVKVDADIRTQRALWLSVISMAGSVRTRSKASPALFRGLAEEP